MRSLRSHRGSSLQAGRRQRPLVTVVGAGRCSSRTQASVFCWDTMNGDLQYACTFALATPRACAASDPSCECRPGSTTNQPLCGAGDQQVRAKAYPTPRQLRVAKGLGERAVVASICAPDPQAGYGPLLDVLADRMSGVLAK